MKRIFLAILAFFMAFAIMRHCQGAENVGFGEFTERLSNYDFSFEETVNHWNHLKQLQANMPKLGAPYEPEPCEGFTDVIAYLGRCIVWLYDTVASFFVWMGAAFNIVGNFIGTIYFVIVDLATTVGDLFSMLAWFCGFTTS